MGGAGWRRLTVGLVTGSGLVCLGTAASIVEQLKQTYSPSTSLRTEFTLEIYWKVREKTQRKKGELLVAPGNKFRVKLGEMLWVCDGSTYWQYSKATGQVIVRNFRDTDLSAHPSQILSAWLHDHSFEEAAGGEGEVMLQWRREEGADEPPIVEICLWVDPATNVVRRMQYTNERGNTSTYTFKKTRLGEQIPESAFTFTVPEGADVLDNR